MRLSASGLWRAELCPASAALPGVDTTHADALAGTEAHSAHEAECPPDELAEVAYAYNPETGKARLLGQGLRRDYPVDWNTEIPGTADRVVHISPPVVRDYKSGHAYGVAPARVNLQLAHNGLCAADVLGASEVTVAIEAEGRQPDVAHLDSFDLAAARQRIRTIWRGVHATTPRVVVGDAQCWRCPAMRACPAHREVLLAVGAGVLGEVLPSVLDDRLLAETWPIYRMARKALGLYEAAARAYVSAVGAVPFGDGRQLALRAGSRESLDGPTVFQALRDMHGVAVAEAAVSMEASKASLGRALGTIAPKGAKAGLVRAALEEIERRNGVTRKQTEPQFVIEDMELALPAKTEAA